MIDDLLIEFDEMGFAPTTVCPNPDEYAIEWREKVRAEFARIETENTELRARLDKKDIFTSGDTDSLSGIQKFLFR